MAGLIGALRVSLSADTAAFEKGLSRAQQKAKASGKGIASSLSKVSAGLTIGLTAPLLAFSKGAFQAASDAQELQSSFDTTFGNMAGAMNKWAETTGNVLGRSTQTMQEGAVAFQELFSKAMDPAQAAKMSAQFAVLVQDLASFKNLSTEVAQQKIFSGLVGESEPLRAVGVLLDEASVKAKAMALGLAGVGNELTQQEKVLARAALITEQLSKAQGDVIRTSGSTANQIRASQEAWEELQIVIGTKLLPVLTPLITSLTGILTKFNELSPATQTWVVGIAAVSAVLGPLLIALGPVVAIFGKLLPLLVGLIPVVATLGRALLALAIAGGPLTLIALAVGAVYTAWQNWDKIEPILRDLYNAAKAWLQDKLGGVINFVKQSVEGLIYPWKKLYEAVVGHSYVPDMIKGVAAWFGKLPSVMVAPTIEATEAVSRAFEDMAGGINDTMARGLVGILRGMSSWKDMALNILDEVFVALERVLATQMGGSSGGIGGIIASALGGAIGGGTTDVGWNSVTGMAGGGSFKIGGRGGTDRNVMGINGVAVARVSAGERVTVSNDNEGRGSIVINQTFAPNFAGNAATKEDLVQMAVMTKADTIRTFRDLRSRGAL